MAGKVAPAVAVVGALAAAPQVHNFAPTGHKTVAEQVIRTRLDAEVLPAHQADRTYTVRPSDTLSAIAQRFYGRAGDWRWLYHVNHSEIPNPDLIHAGEVVKIPHDPPASFTAYRADRNGGPDRDRSGYQPRHSKGSSSGGSSSQVSGLSGTLGQATLTPTPVSTPTPTLPPTGRPTELIQAGDSKTNCISVGGAGATGAPLAQVEQFTGITYNCIETFSDADPAWSNWVSPWVTAPGSYYGFSTWLAADPTGRQIILTQNLIPDSEATNPNWTAECAAGDYDTYATQLAQNLVSSGFGYSVIRLGHEMNGTWYNDDLGTTAAEWQQWGQCFAQEVKTMRAVPGANFLFDWNVNANYRNIPLADFYPGDAYVDIIGIDAYDNSGISLPPVGDPTRWAALTGEPEGLNAVEAFAVAHGKPLSIPEWATVTTQGDDANYVTNMGAFVASHNVAYQSWFDVGDDNIFQLDPTQDPLSAAAYIKAFG